MLRQASSGLPTKANLKRMAAKQRDTSRNAKVTRKNIDSNYVGSRAAVLPLMVKLSNRDSDKSVQEQLCEILKAHQVKLIDLFASGMTMGTAPSTRRSSDKPLPHPDTTRQSHPSMLFRFNRCGQERLIEFPS